MATDGSIVFEVDLNDKQAQAELNRLTKKIDSLNQTLARSKQEKLPFAQQLEKLTPMLDEAKAKLYEMEVASKGQFSSEEIQHQKETVKALQAQWDQANRKVEHFDSVIQKSESDLSASKERAGELVERLSSVEDVGLMERAMEHAKARVREIPQALGNAFKNLGSAALNTLWESIKKIPRALKFAFSKGVQFAKNFGAGLVDVMKKINVFSRMSKSLQGMFGKLGSMLKRVFLFTVITKGLRMVKERMASYLSVNSEFSAALGRIKGALLTAFQPIYDAVVPSLTTLLNTISRVISAISQLVSGVFGTTARQAQSNAKALYQQADATKAAGGAADDASKSLAGFDEINKLSDSSSGGGGGADSSAGAIFDMELSDEKFSSWGAAFDAFLSNFLENGIPQLEKGLSTLSEKINTFSGNLLEMFTFPGVKEKITALGKELASVLNKFVSSIDWNKLGQAIGSGLDAAINFAVSFLYAFDWIALGGSIAELLNGAVSRIDWENVGRLLWSGFKIAIELLAGFIQNLDIDEIIKAAENLAYGFVDSINETFDNIDWDTIGKKIGGLFNAALRFIHTAIKTFEWSKVAEDLATACNSLLDEIDWEELGETISDAFRGALDFLMTVIKTFNWRKIGTSVLMALKAIDWSGLLGDLGQLIGDAFVAALDLISSIKADDLIEIGLDILQGVLNGIWNLMSTIGTWLREHVFDPFISWFKDLFGIHSPSTVMAEIGGNIIDGLLSGLKRAWETVKSWAIDAVNWLLDKFSSATTKLSQVQTNSNFGSVGKQTRSNTISLQSMPDISNMVPALARGAVIPPNREFLAVLGDQKRGINIETPLETMVQAFRQAMSDGGYGGSGNQTAILEVDRQVLGRVVYQLGREEQRRIGVNLAGVNV